MQDDPLRIIQITDTHVYGEVDRDLLGVNTNQSFNALIGSLKNNANLILLTGDLSQDGSEQSYIRIADELSTLQVPVYCVPGNHDNVQTMDRVYPYKTMVHQKQLLIGNWQFILLDSHLNNSVAGYLARKELQFLEQCLKEHPERHTMIVFHHQPIPINSQWLDNLGLKNADEFWEIIKPYQQIKLVLYGHIHQQHDSTYNGIRCLGAPSTCIQFKHGCVEFALENVPPGYRKLDLHADGTMTTSVHRIPEYIGYFDADAKGY